MRRLLISALLPLLATAVNVLPAQAFNKMPQPAVRTADGTQNAQLIFVSKKSARKKVVHSPKPAPVVLPDPPLPVQHLEQIGATKCIDVMKKMSHDTLVQNYNAQSGWNRAAPADHVVQSVAILNNPATSPSDGLVALIASPTPIGSCDGVSVQVFPLASSCDKVRTMMEQKGGTSKGMSNSIIVFDNTGKRLFLLPGSPKTCVAVAVDSTFSEVAAPDEVKKSQ